MPETLTPDVALAAVLDLALSAEWDDGASLDEGRRAAIRKILAGTATNGATNPSPTVSGDTVEDKESVKNPPDAQADAQTDAQGGMAPAIAPEMLARADFITLPVDEPYTTCDGCKFNKGGVCSFHDPEKNIDLRGQPVNDRNCCAEWDNDKALRAWKNPEKKPLDLNSDASPDEESHALAEEYASLFSDLEAAGVSIDPREIDEANGELEGSGWGLKQGHDGSWQAVQDKQPPLRFLRDGDALRYSAAAQWTSMAGQASPHTGRPYSANRWVNNATGKVKYFPAGYDPNNPAEARQKKVEERRARGPVDTGKLKSRLEPHRQAHGEEFGGLDAKQQKSAKLVFAALKRHHGDLAVHRMEELIDQAEKGLARMAGNRPGSEERRKRFKERLAKYHAILEGMGVEPKAGPEEKKPEVPTQEQPVAEKPAAPEPAAQESPAAEPAIPEEKPAAPATPKTPETPNTASPAEQVKPLVDIVRQLGGKHNLADLVDIRKALAERGLNRQQQDEAIYEARRQGLLTVSNYEGMYGGISPEQQEAGFQEPHTEGRIGYLSLRNKDLSGGSGDAPSVQTPKKNQDQAHNPAQSDDLRIGEKPAARPTAPSTAPKPRTTGLGQDAPREPDEEDDLRIGDSSEPAPPATKPPETPKVAPPSKQSPPASEQDARHDVDKLIASGKPFDKGDFMRATGLDKIPGGGKTADNLLKQLLGKEIHRVGESEGSTLYGGIPAKKPKAAAESGAKKSKPGEPDYAHSADRLNDLERLARHKNPEIASRNRKAADALREHLRQTGKLPRQDESQEPGPSGEGLKALANRVKGEKPAEEKGSAKRPLDLNSLSPEARHVVQSEQQAEAKKERGRGRPGANPLLDAAAQVSNLKRQLAGNSPWLDEPDPEGGPTTRQSLQRAVKRLEEAIANRDVKALKTYQRILEDVLLYFRMAEQAEDMGLGGMVRRYVRMAAGETG